ncbi:MAG: hypothetical protein Q8K32_06860 [Archangium sp.]|nr:hypothetical protein [Archangium sp.]
MSTQIGLTNEVLAGFSSDHEPPCLCLYQTTHRRHPENQQDPIRFRNLLKELKASLRQKYPAADTGPLLEPFEALAADAEFWNHTLDGLAVLGGRGVFRALRLPQPVGDLVVVADSFHVKPLRRFLQSVDRYQVLGLSLDKVRLFEGNRHALDELELVGGVPRTIADALGRELTEPHQTVSSHGGVGGASTPMHHGHGGKADEADLDARRFFRAVDRAVLEHYSKPSGLPLILAALPEHHHLFREVSQNPHLIDEGIRSSPGSLSADQLRALAWQAVEPRYQARLAALCEEFDHARSTSVGSDNLAQVAEASSSGRVETLLIEADRQIAGRLEGATGRVELANLNDPHIDDLLDDLGELVAQKGGTVLVIPSEQMPSRTGLAAIYRH